ncbi:ABC transporter permease [Malacoplasma penetrans]|uniref:ABC transporter permease n=1 Tax=Malacoplasma penetrans TaxID=28227 RepID=UPI0010133F0D|nr:ABC transporter permease [Malacoplasma penetrans]RXY97082.1 ABC transporter permease [Malacoplasma penetrans]
MNLKNNKLKSIPELDFEVTEKDFARVDIYKLNRTDQVVGKPSKYLLDIIKRFASNKWALFFLVIFLLIILLAIFAPIISSAMGYSAYLPLAENADSALIANLPARVLGSNPTMTIYNATDSFVKQLEETYKITILSKEDWIPGVAYKVTYLPYSYGPISNFYPVLGTDGSGIDIWTRLWTAVRISLVLAFLVAIASVAIGVVYGSIAGAFAGKAVDTVMMRFVEIISGVPSIVWLLILGIVLVGDTESAGTSINNSVLAVSLIFILWFSPAISTRTYILKTKDVEYVQATRTLGGSQARIIFSHMLPVIAGRIAVIFVNLIPTVIFYESSLVFLGLKPTSDLGLGVMLYEAYSISNIAQIVSPIVVFALFTISSQIIANALNDAIDPRVVGR